VVYLKAYGYRDRDANLPLTPRSVMMAASLTKPTVSYAAMQLVQERALDLDRPVHEYLPKPLAEYPEYQEIAGDERSRRITARMLLAHTSGLPNLRVLNRGRITISFEPGSHYAYSGEGLRLLQLVIEAIARRPISDVMRARIFAPFRMTRTSLVWQPAFENDWASGYNESGRALGPQRRTRPDAAGSMQTTLTDFARFIEAVMQGRALGREARAQMFSPQIAIRSRTQFPTLSTDTTDRNDGIRLSYGLGWGLFWTPAGQAIFKEGHDDGWQHYVVMFPERGTAMLIMSNSSNAEGIFQALLEQVIADTYTPVEWEGYVPYTARPK